jgi:hypothetical protein
MAPAVCIELLTPRDVSLTDRTGNVIWPMG